MVKKYRGKYLFPNFIRFILQKLRNTIHTNGRMEHFKTKKFQIFELLQCNPIIFDYYDFSIRSCTIRFDGGNPSQKCMSHHIS